MEKLSIYDNLVKEPELLAWVVTQANRLDISVEEFAVSVLRSAFTAEKVIKEKGKTFVKFSFLIR